MILLGGVFYNIDWLMMMSISSVSLLIFCLVTLSILLKSPTNDNCEFVYLSFHFCLHFTNLKLHFLMNWPPYYISLSLPDNSFFAVNSTLLDSIIEAPTSFCFMFAWPIFLHHFTCNLPISLYISEVSFCSHKSAGLFFLHTTNLCI